MFEELFADKYDDITRTLLSELLVHLHDSIIALSVSSCLRSDFENSFLEYPVRIQFYVSLDWGQSLRIPEKRTRITASIGLRLREWNLFQAPAHMLFREKDSSAGSDRFISSEDDLHHCLSVSSGYQRFSVVYN